MVFRNTIFQGRGSILFLIHGIIHDTVMSFVMLLSVSHQFLVPEI